MVKYLLLIVCLLLTHNDSPAQDAARKQTAARPQGGRLSLGLSGEWEFQLDPLDEGRTNKWFQQAKQFESKMAVPAAWNAKGAAYPTTDLLHAYEQTSQTAQLVGGSERESEKLFHVYPGPAWYRKTVQVPLQWAGKTPWLILWGVHREAEVWVNGKSAGSHYSYLTPFRIDLTSYTTPGKEVTIVIRVDARRNRERDPLMGCLDTLDFLYITWGGLYRKVTLEATPTHWISDVWIVPRLDQRQAEIKVKLAAAADTNLECATTIRNASGKLVASTRKPINPTEATSTWAADIPDAKLWSPKSPYLYTAEVRLFLNGMPIDTRSVSFGMREFKVSGGKFLLNGAPIFLRGYGDDCIFPNTICPPSDKGEFVRRLTIARDYGFNYVRLHSWFPPQEYFDAADEIGMMVQPEFPFAYRGELPKTPEAKRSAVEQWKEVIRINRNHPCIATWCMGNEQYESFDIAPEMYQAAKELDPTRPVLDTDGCTFAHKDRPTLDFLVVPFAEETSIGFQDRKYDFPKDISKPVVGHEMGYFVTLPDLTQISLFKNGLRPYWLYNTRDLAARTRNLATYPEWLQASFRLQSVCLKTNLEAARRSSLSGTSVWLLQDYPNCAEGILDMFLRPKGISAKEFRQFNAPTVLLMDTARRSCWAGETVDLKLLVSRFEETPSSGASLHWELKAGNTVLGSDTRRHLRIDSGGVQELTSLTLQIPAQTRAERLTFKAELQDIHGKTENSWDLWAFPHDLVSETTRKIRFTSGTSTLRSTFPQALGDLSDPTPANTDLLITTRLNSNTVEYLNAGGRVMLLEPDPVFTVERTNFRLSSWDGGGPSGTIVERNHASLRAMRSDAWCDLNFYPLLQGSKTVLLDPLPVKIKPLIRCVDRPNRLADRAYLFEAAVGKGKLLVSGLNFSGAIESRDPAGIFLFHRLIQYAVGSEFSPHASLPANALVKNQAGK
jgi:beta-galactosidase